VVPGETRRKNSSGGSDVDHNHRRHEGTVQASVAVLFTEQEESLDGKNYLQEVKELPLNLCENLTSSPLFSKLSILTFTTWTKALLLAGFIIVSPT